MVTSSFVRLAGIASLTAAGLMLVHQISQLVFALTMSQSMAIATHSLRNGLALLAMFSLLMALTGLYAVQATSAGRLGLIGYLVAALGTLLLAGDWWYEAFVAPLIAASAPELLRTAPSGSILIGAAATFGSFALGWLLFGIAELPRRRLPARRHRPDGGWRGRWHPCAIAAVPDPARAGSRMDGMVAGEPRHA